MFLYRVFSGLIAAIKYFYLGCFTSKGQALCFLFWNYQDLPFVSFCISFYQRRHSGMYFV